VTAIVDLDPWGLETARSQNSQQQPRKYTTYERDGNGSDEAMMRRYNRWHLRFDQPDPYDGGYDLTDPQSFNRYAYVQNDPVNFTDPSGLVRKCFTIGDGEGGERSICFDLPDPLPPLRNPRDGGGGPQERGPGQQINEQKGCYEFADEVARIASQHSLDYGFAQALWKRFSTANQEFGGKDFKPEFRDDTPKGPGHTDNSPNQARHYVGTFTAGHLGGETIGRGYSNIGEPRGGTPSNRADRALNRVAARHGSSLNGLFGNSPRGCQINCVNEFPSSVGTRPSKMIAKACIA